jgi:hypothetical protein
LLFLEMASASWNLTITKCTVSGRARATLMARHPGAECLASRLAHAASIRLWYCALNRVVKAASLLQRAIHSLSLCLHSLNFFSLSSALFVLPLRLIWESVMTSSTVRSFLRDLFLEQLVSCENVISEMCAGEYSTGGQRRR